MSNSNLYCIYEEKVPVQGFTKAGTIPSSDRQENKKAADVREPGCQGAQGCRLCRTCWDHRRGGRPLCAAWAQPIVLCCLFKPGSNPLFAPGLSPSQQKSWHYDMVRLHLKPQPTHYCLIIDASHACFNRFWQINVMNIFAEGKSWDMSKWCPVNRSMYLILMVEFNLYFSVSSYLEV